MKRGQIPVEVGDDRIDLFPQLGLVRDDPCDLGVQLLDVDRLAGILLLDIGGDGKVVAVFSDLAVIDEAAEVVDFAPRDERFEDLLLVRIVELVPVP